MTSVYVPVSPEKHLNLRWRRIERYAFARDLQTIDIALPESAALCMTCPILFRKAGRSFVPIVLLGAEPKQNAFVDPDFRWIGGYVPALLRGQPFRMAPAEGGQLGLFVDSREVTEGGGEPFFTPDGTPAEPLQAMVKFLTQVENGRRDARVAADALARAGVIKPLLSRAGKGEEPRPVEGLFTVEEAALKALPDPAFAALRGSGALKFAYHQLLSLETWPTLVKLSRRLRAHRQDITKKAATIYQPADDGDLQIDWSQFKPPAS